VKMVLRACILLLLLLSLGISPILAQDHEQGLDTVIGILDKAESRRPQDLKDIIIIVSEELGIDRENIQRQREETGFGYGQIFIANALAKETGKTFEEIVAEFKSGKGFGRIAKENGLKLGPLVKRAKHARDRIKGIGKKGWEGSVTSPYGKAPHKKGSEDWPPGQNRHRKGPDKGAKK